MYKCTEDRFLMEKQIIVLDGGSRFGGDGQTIFMDRRLSEIWRELALHYFWVECFGGSQLGGDGQIVMMFR